MPPSPPPSPRRYVLEPLRPALIGVTLAHLVVAGIIAWLTLGQPATAERSSDPVSRSDQAATDLRWFRPADFQKALPLTRVAEPIPTPTAAATPAPSRPPVANRNTSRYITLSRLQTPPSNASVAESPQPQNTQPPARNALDAVTLSHLDRIDEALYEAFMQAWSPPTPDQRSALKLTARLDITLTPEVLLEQADLVVPSGSTDLDLSVLMAVEKVAERLRNRLSNPDAGKFPTTLPSSFQNSRYVCRIQFQIE